MKVAWAFFICSPLVLLSCTSSHKTPFVSTLAGQRTMGLINGQGTQAKFALLMGVVADDSGQVFVADSHNNVIRKIDKVGLVTTVAGTSGEGSGDGPANSATFFYPCGVALDKWGNIYVADTRNSLVRKIDRAGSVSTVAGRVRPDEKPGIWSADRFDNPSGIAVDSHGVIYLADWGRDLIRKIDTAGKVSTLAGDGTPGATDGQGALASFYLPGGLAIDQAGYLYVADTYNNMIRKISPSGLVTTLAGKKTKGNRDGKGSEASFSHPAGIAVDSAGNLYVADVGNNKIRKITADGMVTTYAGSGLRGADNGPAATASFYRPFGVTIDKKGVVYVADYENNQIRKIDP